MTRSIEILDGEEWQSSEAIDDYASFLNAINFLHSECIDIRNVCCALSELMNKKDLSKITASDLNTLLEICNKLLNSKIVYLSNKAIFNLKNYSNRLEGLGDNLNLQGIHSKEFVNKFGEYLTLALTDLTDSSMRRSKEGQALRLQPRENHLRKIFKNIANKINQELHFPKLIIEKKINDDYQDAQDSHGCTDYFFAKDYSQTYDFSNVLATFEVKGPTRPSLLKGSKKNWYPKILKDVRKQLWRSINFPHTSNYVAIIFRSSPDLSSLKLANLLRKELESEFDELKVKLEDCYWREVDCQFEVVYVSILRVIFKNE